MSKTSVIEAKAIVFDADGTLFNSFELIVASYKHISETHNLRVPTPDEIRLQLGNSLPDIFQDFYPEHNVLELLKTNNAFMAANLMKSEAYEGLNEMLELLHDLGFKLAILTSGGHNIVNVLKHHRIDKYFASIVHHERITKPKPDPEGFLLAAKECDVDANESVMVGDTVNDVLVGKNALSLATVAITHGYGNSDDLVKAGADYIVDSLSHFSDLAMTFQGSKLVH